MKEEKDLLFDELTRKQTKGVKFFVRARKQERKERDKGLRNDVVALLVDLKT